MCSQVPTAPDFGGILFILLVFFLFVLLSYTLCGILIPKPGMEPAQAVSVES